MGNTLVLTPYEREVLRDIISFYKGVDYVDQREFPQIEEIAERHSHVLSSEPMETPMTYYINEKQFVQLWVEWWHNFGRRGI